jgi:outer membrane cobalamin receptor
MKIHRRSFVSLGVAMAAGALTISVGMGSAARAKEPEDQPVSLPDLEVIGRPVASVPEADRYAATAATVSARQLQEMEALDFASALRRTPGVTITRFNQVGAFGGAEGGALFLRGLGTSRPGGEIKTLVDGVPKLNGIFNHPLLDLMSVDSAAKIEVHGRATPLEFGNMFGAVNITTPRLEKPGRLVRATAAAGSFGTFVGRFDFGTRDDVFECYASGSIREADGHRPDAGGRMENYLLRLGWNASTHWEASYVVNHTHNRATDPGIEGAPLGPPSTRGEQFRTDDWFQVATLTHHLEGATGTLRAYLNEGGADWLCRQVSGNADSLANWRLYGMRWRETLAPWSGGEVLAGADLDYNRGSVRLVPPAPAPAGSFGPMVMRVFSPYFGVSHILALPEGAMLTPSVGVRHYSHSEFESQWAPQAGLTLTTGQTRFHLAGSRAVNYPGLEVAVFSQLFIPALAQSWRTLRPEQADQFEAGVRHAFNDRFAFAVTLFRNRARDRYVIVFPPPPPPRYTNLGSYRTEGIELTAETAWRETLAVFASASLLRATPDGIPYAPRHTLAAGLNWQVAPGWRLSADCAYVAAMHTASEARVAGSANPAVVGANLLLNARLSHHFSWGAERGEIYLSGENLTDRNFAYQPGYPVPGINFMVGVRLEK